MLATQVFLLTRWAAIREHMKDVAKGDRGSVYAEVLWATTGIVAAIAIATVLYVKFKASAKAVPTDAPGISGGVPVTSLAGP